MWNDDGDLARRVAKVPGAYRSLVPRTSCRKGCVNDWRIDEVATTPPVALVKISRVEVRPAKDMCEWQNETRFGTFVREQGKLRELKDAPATYQLAAAFAEHGEAKVLLYGDSGLWIAFGVDDGKASRTIYSDHEIYECGEWVCCCGC